MPLRDVPVHFKQPHPFGCMYYALQCLVTENVIVGPQVEDASSWNFYRYVRSLGYELLPMFYSCERNTAPINEWRAILEWAQTFGEGEGQMYLIGCRSSQFSGVFHEVAAAIGKDFIEIYDPNAEGIQRLDHEVFLETNYAQADHILQLTHNNDETFPPEPANEAPHLQGYSYPWRLHRQPTS